MEKFWKTLKWNTRVVTSILSSSMVDAFCAWEHHFPPNSDATEDIQSRLKSFVAKVIDEIKPVVQKEPEFHLESECQLELIGKRLGKEGKSKGKVKTTQGRCHMCVKRGNKMADGRATRTSWRCKAHPDVHICAGHSGPCLALHREEQGEI